MKISVVICTYNRAAYLPLCLNHLKNQIFDSTNFEIVIVNNNSTDNTDNICQHFISQNLLLNIQYVIEKNPGLSNARNKGIELSRGEIIAFIDDDGFAKPDYLTNIVKVTSDEKYNDYIAFGGKVTPVYNKGKEPKWLSKYIDGVVSKVDLGTSIIPFAKKYPAGCNMIFRKEFFTQYGGFNTDLHTRGDDKFVFDKLIKNNEKTLYIPNIEVNHFIDDYRLEKAFIIRLSKIIGQSEAIRLKENVVSKIIKFLEYLFKFGAAVALSIIFIIKNEWIKAKYILLVRYNVIIGFFIKGKL